RHDRAAMFAERRERRALGRRVERRQDFVALSALALQLVENRLQVRAARFAVQRGVAVALETGLAQIGVGVADRLGELRAGRVRPPIDPFAAADATGKDRPVRGEDAPALDSFLLERGAPLSR